MFYGRVSNKIYTVFIALCCFAVTQAQHAFHDVPFRKGKLLFKDDFNSGLQNWVAEYVPGPSSQITITNSRLVMDVAGGATVWYNRRLSGNIMIEFRRTVRVAGGPNDRLSDLNVFWMARDPRNANLFTRHGEFSEYDSLQLYYVGFGGNTNTTTRFRKYTGNGERVLYGDLADQAHLLEPNKVYLIRVTVYQGTTSFFVNDRMFFSFKDRDALRVGYFGFRTTASRHEMDDFKVYQLR